MHMIKVNRLYNPGGLLAMFAYGGVCHVFVSEISLESHFWGSKICNMNFPIFFFGGGGG